MKTPVDTVTGTIVEYDDLRNEVVIRAHYDDVFTLCKRSYSKVLVQMIDSRPLSDKQRRACYALIREIADYCGEGTESAKNHLKLKFLADEFGETADKIFSLSNGSMSLVCAFQRFLVRFILDYDIPCNFPLLNYVDDVSDYLYGCLINKKCCVCGKPSDLHHYDQVGMGRDREEIVHEGMRVLPLCRDHHTEYHTIGHVQFSHKYHIYDGIELDKTLCKIYKLKTKKGDKKNAE